MSGILAKPFPQPGVIGSSPSVNPLISPLGGTTPPSMNPAPTITPYQGGTTPPVTKTPVQPLPKWKPITRGLNPFYG